MPDTCSYRGEGYRALCLVCAPLMTYMPRTCADEQRSGCSRGIEPHAPSAPPGRDRSVPVWIQTSFARVHHGSLHVPPFFAWDRAQNSLQARHVVHGHLGFTQRPRFVQNKHGLRFQIPRIMIHTIRCIPKRACSLEFSTLDGHAHGHCLPAQHPGEGGYHLEQHWQPCDV